MLVDFELKAGLVFGIETDTIYTIESMDDATAFKKEDEHTAIYVHLGFVSISLIL